MMYKFICIMCLIGLVVINPVGAFTAADYNVGDSDWNTIMTRFPVLYSSSSYIVIGLTIASEIHNQNDLIREQNDILRDQVNATREQTVELSRIGNVINGGRND